MIARVRARRASSRAIRFAPLIAVAAALLASAGCADLAERLDWIGSDANAEWIRLDHEAQLGIYRKPRMIHFRREFQLDRETSAQLHLRAMRQVAVYLDDQRIFRTDAAQVGWASEQTIDLGPHLSAGDHTLTILVFNAHGACLLLAHAPGLDIATGPRWLASEGGEAWAPAALASEPMVAPLALRFGRADEAALEVLPALVGVVLAAWFALWRVRLRGLDRLRAWFGGNPAPRARALLSLFAAALLLNDAFRLPQRLGFDIVGHYDYMRFIIERSRIPLATDGWQMFQSPLYYLIAAPLYALLGSLFDPSTVKSLMRMLSIASGLCLIEICHRATRSTFPQRPALQICAAALASFLPVNLWIAPYVGNEPMAACLTAAALLLVYRALASPSEARSARFQWWLGALLGSAMLTKVTAVLALLPVALALIWALRRAGAGLASGAAAAVRVGVALLAVCGWYYGRNWLLLGSPFVGGWSDDRGIAWWQDPGYRHIGDYARFGEALIHPFYAAFSSFWDGLYSTFWLDGFTASMITYEARPPWNYAFMAALPWISLPLSALMLLSALAIKRPAVWFSWCCVGVYLLAMIALHLSVPHYSAVKASYMLGLAPCFCVMLAAGLDQLPARWQPYACGWIAVWALASYAAFFVIS